MTQARWEQMNSDQRHAFKMQHAADGGGDGRGHKEGYGDALTSVTVSGDCVVSGSGDNSVRCVSLSTGAESWVYEGRVAVR